MGSEFAFEDLSSFEVEKFTYKHLRDEELDGLDMHVVEMIPVDKYSGYKRSNVWIDKEHKRFFKVDFYDRRDTLLKTLTVKSYSLYLDKYWRPDEQFMVNHKSGKSTDLAFTSFRFDVGLTDGDFNEKRLERIR